MLTRQQLYDLYYKGPRAIIHLVENLLAHLADVERFVGHRQQMTIDGLAQKVKLLLARVGRLKAELWKEQSLNVQLTRRIQQLQAELERQEASQHNDAAAVARPDSHNSHLPPGLDLPGAKAANSVRRTRSLRQRNGLKVGGQRGHRGATLLRVERPDRVVIHTPDSCQQCATPLSDATVIAIERRQVFEIPPVKVEVTEHCAETRRCSACGARTKAQFPREVKAPVQYGEGVRARAVYLHKYQLLPFARTSEAMKELFGCSISPATVHTTRARCATKLVHTEERIKTSLRQAAVVGADETGIRVGGQNQWVHVVRTDRLTHYAYDARRGKAAIDAIGILPAFTGTCVRDGWDAYNQYRQCQHSLCNAHLLRELIYIEEVCEEQKQWTSPLIKLLLEIKAATFHARSAGAEKLGEDQQARFFARYDRLVKRAARLNPPPKKERRDPTLPKFKVVRIKHHNPAVPLVHRLAQKRAEVLRFMTDLWVPFDNNGSERDLRIVKLQQKIGGCFRTPEGAEAFCRIRSYLSTARKQGHPVLAALERAFRGKPLTFKGLNRPE
jgi:transposase